MSGERPVWQQLYDGLTLLSTGAKPDDEVMLALALNNFVISKEVTKPCRTCGTPRPDYSYFRITQAGRIFMEAAALATASSGVKL